MENSLQSLVNLRCFLRWRWQWASLGHFVFLLDFFLNFFFGISSIFFGFKKKLFFSFLDFLDIKVFCIYDQHGFCIHACIVYCSCAHLLISHFFPNCILYFYPPCFLLFYSTLYSVFGATTYSHPVLCTVLWGAWVWYWEIWSGKYNFFNKPPFLVFPFEPTCNLFLPCSLFSVLYYGGLGSDFWKFDLGNISFVSIIFSCISFWANL